jgi:hypothetical protein
VGVKQKRNWRNEERGVRVTNGGHPYPHPSLTGYSPRHLPPGFFFCFLANKVDGEEERDTIIEKQNSS